MGILQFKSANQKIYCTINYYCKKRQQIAKKKSPYAIKRSKKGKSNKKTWHNKPEPRQNELKGNKRVSTENGTDKHPEQIYENSYGYRMTYD
jgi:hypothetical protein